jgi:hypothetical protein
MHWTYAFFNSRVDGKAKGPTEGCDEPLEGVVVNLDILNPQSFEYSIRTAFPTSPRLFSGRSFRSSV